VEIARKRTLAEASARIELLLEQTWDQPKMPYRRRRRGGVLRPFLTASKAGAKLVVSRAICSHFGPLTAEGVIDMAGRRYMLDYGSYARLYADGKEWDGRSGRPLATLPPNADPVPTPLWLLDIVAGFTGVCDVEAEAVRGNSCRHVTGTIDLSRAPHMVPSGVAVPACKRYEDLLSMPIDIWIDDTHIRRVRFGSKHFPGPSGHRSETLELWDYGVSLDNLDWTRLPAFRLSEATRGRP
jgi:hypothetical protein